MGFSNGYDSGYSDALEDVRSGRVAGLGPAQSGGSAPTARAPGYFVPNSSTLPGHVVVPGGITAPIEYGLKDAIPLDTTSTAETIDHPEFPGDTMTVYHISIAAPTGGFVKGDLVFLLLNADDQTWEYGFSVVLDGQDIRNLFASYTQSLLIARFNGTSFTTLLNGATY